MLENYLPNVYIKIGLDNGRPRKHFSSTYTANMLIIGPIKLSWRKKRNSWSSQLANCVRLCGCNAISIPQSSSFDKNIHYESLQFPMAVTSECLPSISLFRSHRHRMAANFWEFSFMALIHEHITNIAAE